MARCFEEFEQHRTPSRDEWQIMSFAICHSNELIRAAQAQWQVIQENQAANNKAEQELVALGEELRHELAEHDRLFATLRALHKAGRKSGDSELEAAYDASSENRGRCLELVQAIEAKLTSPARVYC
ncbi:hypothetical protein C7I84_21620 [Mesorhizobium ephedrae]|uniref:Uncharacterized protein n=2 Tax=Kumtagia ephedrae TaxID=2116701 RepID=A0A2P7S118_9HYPH|nr:hypothetical protein C7I84_21620 [Mesorhizobium ephedrae]